MVFGSSFQLKLRCICTFKHIAESHVLTDHLTDEEKAFPSTAIKRENFQVFPGQRPRGVNGGANVGIKASVATSPVHVSQTLWQQTFVHHQPPSVVSKAAGTIYM
jgi:hypothetical protein